MKNAVHQIIDTLTSAAIEQRLRVSSHSVRAAKTKGQFPASWYDGLFLMCSEAGIACPRKAFNFRLAKKDSNTSSANQDLAAGKISQAAS